MTTYLVTRHQGAVDWMDYMGHYYDKYLTHLQDYASLKAEDCIVGSLPINIVAELNQMGVSYYHLSLAIPEELRGIELSVDQLAGLNAKLEHYEVKKVDH